MEILVLRECGSITWYRDGDDLVDWQIDEYPSQFLEELSIYEPEWMGQAIKEMDEIRQSILKWKIESFRFNEI